MTVAFADTSALFRRYVNDTQHSPVISTMAEHDQIVVSSMARGELELTARYCANGPATLSRLWSAIDADWASFWVVPTDGRCLDRAAEIAGQYGISITMAIPLAAADRLSRPVAFLTLSNTQSAAAADLGMDTLLVPGG